MVRLILPAVSLSPELSCRDPPAVLKVVMHSGRRYGEEIKKGHSAGRAQNYLDNKKVR
jgi:hypothetical protein